MNFKNTTLSIKMEMIRRPSRCWFNYYSPCLQYCIIWSTTSVLLFSILFILLTSYFQTQQNVMQLKTNLEMIGLQVLRMTGEPSGVHNDEKSHESFDKVIDKHTERIIREISDTRCRVNKMEQEISRLQSVSGIKPIHPDRVDFALESLGGSVLSAPTEMSDESYSFFSFVGDGKIVNSPRLVIQPSTGHPGDCFAFKGSTGSITIQLMGSIFVDTISMEHITAAQSPTGSITSAPKEISVFGLKSQGDENPFHFGTFTYKNVSNVPVQMFVFEKQGTHSFPIIRVDFLSNHGNEEYTCVYRVRVHGILDAR